ncbi:CRIB domain-containing protein [Drosera capensis]
MIYASIWFICFMFEGRIDLSNTLLAEKVFLLLLLVHCGSMKGFLKGLRYIQQIFEDANEPEMQIGLPTDVKHVAHIGWDGPTVSAPTWMNNYRSEADSAGPPSGFQMATTIGSRDAKPPMSERQISLTSNDSPMGSPSRRRSDKAKHSRRHNSAGSGDSSSTINSPKRSAMESRRLPGSNLGHNSPARDSGSAAPKSSRRKKPKNSSGESSRGTSRSKNNSMMANDGYPFSSPGALDTGMDTTLL